jgi:hypothetical protein
MTDLVDFLSPLPSMVVHCENDGIKREFLGSNWMEL